MIKLTASSIAEAQKIINKSHPGLRLHVAGNETPVGYYAVTQAEWAALHPANTDRRLDYEQFRDKFPSYAKWLDTWELARTNADAWRFMVRLGDDKGVVLNSQRVADFLQLLVDNNVLTNNQRNSILS